MDPGLTATGVAVFELPEVTPGWGAALGVPASAMARFFREVVTIKVPLVEGEGDNVRMQEYATLFDRYLTLIHPDHVVIEIPARDNVYRATAKRQRDKGSTMNLAEVMRNVRLGAVLAGVAAAGADSRSDPRAIHFYRADDLKKRQRAALLSAMKFGGTPPTNEHERDATWLGLRWLARNGMEE